MAQLAADGTTPALPGAVFPSATLERLPAALRADPATAPAAPRDGSVVGVVQQLVRRVDSAPGAATSGSRAGAAYRPVTEGCRPLGRLRQRRRQQRGLGQGVATRSQGRGARGPSAEDQDNAAGPHNQDVTCNELLLSVSLTIFGTYFLYIPREL